MDDHVGVSLGQQDLEVDLFHGDGLKILTADCAQLERYFFVVGFALALPRVLVLRIDNLKALWLDNLEAFWLVNEDDLLVCG